MKRKIISLGVVCVMLMSSLNMSFAATFSDVDSTHWAEYWIDIISRIGIVNGYPDGSFKPSNQVKNGEFFKMMVMADVPKYSFVPPVAGEHWANQYITLFKKMYSLFDLPKEYTTASELNSVMTREEMAALMYIFYGDRNWGKLEESTSFNDVSFTDKSAIDSKYIEQVKFCVQYGILNGFEDNTFKPKDGLTRAQAVKVLYKCLYE